MAKQFQTVIFWFRRDLRVDDNIGLSKACELADYVVPVYIHDQEFDEKQGNSPFKSAFKYGCLIELNKDIEKHGSRLIVRVGDSKTELAALVKEVDANSLFFNRSYEPDEIVRDKSVAEAMQPIDVTVNDFKDQLLFEPWELEHERPGGYMVYTPFRKALMAKTIDKSVALPDKINSPKLIKSIESNLDKARPLESAQPILEPGSRAAHTHLDEFVGRLLHDYPVKRDFIADDGTSRLSAYLNVGAISARTMAASISGLTGGEKWLSELFWREFYASILFHNPHAQHGPLRTQFNSIEWRDDKQEFDAWRAGKTGYPVVDAAMRQLQQTGWMHNRARMIVASFLTKDLLINWQHGEKHFMEFLTDGDLAQNNGGWQWSAGTGTDAQPYFRIFNPILQSRKFDPEAKYIHKWIPELADVPVERIHAPWEMTPLEQEYANCRIGKDYPAPIVDHSVQRQITLAAYKVSSATN